jgi:hypothetical protein
MKTVPPGERVFLLLARGEKGNGELAVGMVFPDQYGAIDCYWTWGGPNSGSDIDEAPIGWAALPSGWDAGLTPQNHPLSHAQKPPLATGAG